MVGDTDHILNLYYYWSLSCMATFITVYEFGLL